MAFKTALWTVQGDSLQPVPISRIDREQDLESWIERDPSILDMNVAIIGRQVITDHGKRIDLLAMDAEGRTVIIELKRDSTPRDVVAQVLDYASWVRGLGYERLNEITQKHRGKPLAEVFRDTFDGAPPESVNESHLMVIVASALDDDSERIVEYLKSYARLPINAVFFNMFDVRGTPVLSRSWLADPEEVAEAAEPGKRSPWTGYYVVNVGDSPVGVRPWADRVKFGFVSAGGGRRYSKQLERLSAGCKFFAFLKGRGYVGLGEVAGPLVPIREFRVSGGKSLFDVISDPHKQGEYDPETAEYAVPVKWHKTLRDEHAKWVEGLAATPAIVYKLKQPKTVEFLCREFGVGSESIGG